MRQTAIDFTGEDLTVRQPNIRRVDMLGSAWYETEVNGQTKTFKSYTDALTAHDQDGQKEGK